MRVQTTARIVLIWVDAGATPGTKELVMNLLWAVAVILVIAWVFGFTVLHVSSALIHLLLVLAVVVVIARLVTGRRI
jgi:hypothetical protein